jgi:hypothetical protein
MLGRIAALSFGIFALGFAACSQNVSPSPQTVAEAKDGHTLYVASLVDNGKKISGYIGQTINEACAFGNITSIDKSAVSTVLLNFYDCHIYGRRVSRVTLR